MFARYKSAVEMGRSAHAAARRADRPTNFCSRRCRSRWNITSEAAGVQSKTYKLDVIDMPAIKKVKVTYHYPSWLQLPDATEDPGGDLRAVAGTVAELTVETDRPLKNGHDGDGRRLAYRARSGRERNTLTAKVPIKKDGMYHFAAERTGAERAPERGLFHRSARRQCAER